ncbi:hypothetical protein [Nocardia macrotermitis]|uniref:Uncharacterized protein n=1 Tax=Nocardia macrotermitis TaxID=2585198 RepID=A0A7K0DAP2_9NOCA|nr:hypothetical protein [Nocardia macrotermitis]MQY22679.1 hypothetical protein [Nocardia macrotermitis]
MTSNNSGGNGVDWDGELQALMESSGIDPAQVVRPKWVTRARRRVFGAKSAVAAVAVMAPVGWVVAESGAPVIATAPMLLWFAGWIGFGVYVSLGRPDLSTTSDTVAGFAVRVSHTGSRFAYARTRPARVRWRAWRAAQARDAAVGVESGQVTR